MELRHLRTFLAVAETLNISEAARRLRATQPALSRQIRALEDVVGRPLFIRAAGRLRLTPTGETLQERSRDIIAAFDSALHTARKAGADADTSVRIGYHPTVTVWAGVVSPAVDRLLRIYPEAKCQVIETNCVQLLENIRTGALDVALLTRGDYGNPPGVVLEKTGGAPGLIMLAANHRLAKRRALSIDELREEEIIGVTPEIAPGRERPLIDACVAAGFMPRVSLIASSPAELALELKRRMGVAMVGTLALAEPHPGFVFTKLNPPVLLHRYIARSDQASPMAIRLAELIAAEVERLHAQP
jgi:DNA-binding transcriptional LysR family regulator